MKEEKVHPCAVFPVALLHLSVTMTLGIQLLAVKLALEELWHWLEGSKVPFVVWADHENLEYIRTANCLNACMVTFLLVVDEM